MGKELQSPTSASSAPAPDSAYGPPVADLQGGMGNRFMSELASARGPGSEPESLLLDPELDALLGQGSASPDEIRAFLALPPDATVADAALAGAAEGVDLWVTVHAGRQTARGLVDSAVGLLRAWDVAADALEELLPEFMDSGAEPEEMIGHWVAAELTALADEYLAADPKYRVSFLATTVPHAVGSIVAFVAGGAATTALKGSGTVAMMLAGGGMAGDAQYEAARANGADISTARTAFAMGLLTGPLQGLVIGRLVGRLDVATGGRASQLIARFALTGAENLAQAFLQTVSDNLVAQALYDEDRELFEGALASGSASGIAAVLFHAAASGVRAGRVRLPAKAEDASSAPEVLPGERAPLTSEELASASDHADRLNQRYAPDRRFAISSDPTEITAYSAQDNRVNLGRDLGPAADPSSAPAMLRTNAAIDVESVIAHEMVGHGEAANAEMWQGVPGKPPVVAFRGTQVQEIGSVFADIDPSGIGMLQFKDNYPLIREWMNRAAAHGPVVVTGHSLGGSLAQIAGALMPSLTSRIITFASPGVGPETIQALRDYNVAHPDKAISSTHHRTEGDIVPAFGRGFTDGEIHIRRTTGIEDPLSKHISAILAEDPTLNQGMDLPAAPSRMSPTEFVRTIPASADRVELWESLRTRVGEGVWSLRSRFGASTGAPLPEALAEVPPSMAGPELPRPPIAADPALLAALDLPYRGGTLADLSIDELWTLAFEPGIEAEPATRAAAQRLLSETESPASP